MTSTALSDWMDRQAGKIFILPAVGVILLFSIFPLLASAWLALTRFSLEAGGYQLKFIGAANFRKLITGSQQFHLLGTPVDTLPQAWLLIAAVVLLLWLGMARSLQRSGGFFGAARVPTRVPAAVLTAAGACVAVLLAPIGPLAALKNQLAEPLDWPWAAWLALSAVIFVAAAMLARRLGAQATAVSGLVGRQLSVGVTVWVTLIAAGTLGPGGQQGSVLTTLFYVVAGVSLQFAIGLGLALLCAQPIRARDFFRLTFFLPLMVTPVGIAYMFRMMADTGVGPFAPIAKAIGLGAIAWGADAWLARWVVLIGDTWQWVPFIFIVMLAAVEGQPRDQLEAAQLDGAPAWRIFRDITWPAIAPTAAAVVLIRLIEAFKIVDLPNVLTNGGPGIATESLTLHAFIDWRSLNLGGSAAVAYMLLFISTVAAVSFFNFVVRPARGEH